MYSTTSEEINGTSVFNVPYNDKRETIGGIGQTMQGAIVTPFTAVRTVLRQLIHSIDPGINILEEMDISRIDAMVRQTDPAFIFVSLPPVAEGGMHQVGRIKLSFPKIPLAVMVRYDYPEYMAITKTLGIDHLIYEERMDRKIIQRVVENATARRYEIRQPDSSLKLPAEEMMR